MGAAKTAKLFMNGASQAVRLPAEFRFEGDEVFVRRDDLTGDVILSKKRPFESWEEFLAMLPPAEDVPDDFMRERPMNVPPEDRGIFDDEI